MVDRVGQQLGNYRLVRLLGQGGFADVYLGEHIHLGTEAAIKVLATRLTGEEFEHFRSEARTIARLKHAHIIRVLEFGIDETTPFLVMDYAPNGTLRKLYPKGTRLPLPAIVHYVKQVAEALQYAHNNKLIHRDIKPENMLLGERQEVLLSDFGIAIVAQSSRYDRTQDTTGTIAYMAPEQIQAHPRPASDQYSLGIVVYEWLSGDRPFGGSFTEIAAKHVLMPPPFLREKIPTIPLSVEEVVLTALAKDPKQRFGSVQAFANALEQASQSTRDAFSYAPPIVTPPNQVPRPIELATPPGQQGQPPVIFRQPSQATPPAFLPPSGVPSASRRISRRTLVLGLGLAGLAVAGGGIAWLLSSRTSQSPAPPSPTPTPTPIPIPLGTLLYTYRGHSSPVESVAWSPDGRRIASGSDDRTVQVWDASDGSHIYTYRGHSDRVWAVTWSSDSQRIASGSDDHTVQVWDASDGSHVYTYRGHSNWVFAVAWSPDGRRIASGGQDNTVQVWDAANGVHAFTYRGHSSFVAEVAWSPNGQRIASGSDDHTVQVWDAADGGHSFTYHGHSDSVQAVTWSPDGRHIASGGLDNTVQVWDATNGSHVYTYRGHSGQVRGVAWSLDGRRIASGSADNTVQVWDAFDGGHAFTYNGHSALVDSVVRSPDGRRFASAGDDHTVQVWGAG